MSSSVHEGNRLVLQHCGQTLWVEPYGPDVIRVRSTPAGQMPDRPFALIAAQTSSAQITTHEDETILTNGGVCAICDAHGNLTFLNAAGKELLSEQSWPHRGTRAFRHIHGEVFSAAASFKAYDGERLWGLGQHRHGLLNQKGCVLELVHYNTHISIPFLLSSRGYGVLWNNPAVGRVELTQTHTRWVADATTHIDYLVIAGKTYADILARYADITGHAPEFPEFATGFWQSKLRYHNQQELLQVACEYKERGLPISVIVIDYFHWTMMGDWKFDPKHWPDPAGMVRELREMGIELMVSVWPTVNPDSENYKAMEDRGLLVRSENGPQVQRFFVDTPHDGTVYLPFYDATNPQARAFLWERLKENYVKYGIRLFWLDCNEPEIYPLHFDNCRFAEGNGAQVAGLYPREHCRAIYEGLQDDGEKPVLSLARCTWAGGQRYGSVIWSGDIPSTFASLAEQIRAGLNMSLSGIPWWTTDIGGFHGGDINCPTFRELIVRWFQYGVFCPIFRLHGARKGESSQPESFKNGGPNELWSFGEQAYPILRAQLLLRERLRPYVSRQMQIASQTGLPPMRPVFVDFQNDPKCLDIDDQFMLGPDLLVCPIAQPGHRRREVYLPAGTAWLDFHTGERHAGGQIFQADAPLERIPVYVREGASIESR